MSDILVFALILSVLIIGHEAGHFFAAKFFKIQVTEFGLGYPPRLLTLFKYHETSFTLNWIPFGGFVRIAGEDDPSVEDGLSNSSKIARSMILLAGPLANVILAILAFTLAFRFAAPDAGKVLITEIAPGSPAESAGIMVDDMVSYVNDTQIDGILTMQQTISNSLEKSTSIGVIREGELIEITLVPRSNPPEGEGAIGVILGNPLRESTWPEAFVSGLDATWFQVDQLIHLPGMLFRGEVSSEEARITGLKGMYDMVVWAGEIDQENQRPFLTLTLIGVISIGFSIANLLPFPALDGGRLFFVFIEMILGKRIPAEFEGMAHAVGFIILMGLLVYVNLQDIINPIALP
ncbi:MAG: site-2 protease family protein [Anaerolineales bacterium]|nr:site-2 protease family protein [Anaerolineales bacterium]